MSNEEWKDIKEYIGLYKVSNKGRVMSLQTYNKMKSHIKVNSLNKHRGYLIVILYNRQKRRTVPIHRLVAGAFIPNPNNYPCINHIDGNKQNNNVENLEWCTYKHNTRHAIRTGLTHFVYGESISKKLKEKDIHEIFRLKSERYTHKQISKVMGIPESTIAHIALHNNWKYVKIDKEILKKIESNKHRWALKYDRCIRCHRNDLEHNGKGLCVNCYQFGIRNGLLDKFTAKYNVQG